MAKATSKFSTPLNRDVPIEETATVTDVNEVVETPLDQGENIEQIEAIDVALTPGVEDLGTETLLVEEVKQPEVIEVSIAPTVVVKAEPEVVEQSDLEKLLAKVEAEGNTYRKGIIHTLNTYCSDMKPGKVVEAPTGARSHFQLWHGILSIIDNCPEEEFRSTWNLILAYFNLNKDSALNDRYIFRFMHEWAQGNDQCKAYQHIINLIKLTMDPQQRANGLKQVSLERSLTDVISEAGRSKLIAFYQA